MQRGEGRQLRDAPGLGATEWSRDFTFVQMADTQLGLAELFGKVNGIDGVTGWSLEKEMMELAVAHINRIKPAFAIVCGDLVNESPFGDDAKRKAQISDFNAVLSKIDPTVPLICVCGNHDVGNIPNRESIDKYKADFGDDYFSFWCKGVKCIVVNSQLWKDASAAPQLALEHAAWLSRQLASSAAGGARHTLVFGHIPIFLESANEPDSYFNLTHDMRIRLLDELVAAGCSHYFCGHYHRNGGGVYKAPAGGSVEVVITGAVGTNIVDRPGGRAVKDGDHGEAVMGPTLSGLRVVKVGYNSVRHKWCTFAELQRRGPVVKRGSSPKMEGRRHSSKSPPLRRSVPQVSPHVARARLPSTATTVRRIERGEWSLLKSARLEALRDSPDAFDLSYETVKKRPRELWVQQVEAAATGDMRCTFVAIDERGNPVGIASLYRDLPGGSEHTLQSEEEAARKAEIVQFWVAPLYRGASTGMAKRLLDCLLEWGRKRGVHVVTLQVKPGNRRALSFYARNGFVVINTDGSAGALEERSDERMALSLTNKPVSYYFPDKSTAASTTGMSRATTLVVVALSVAVIAMLAARR
eukprot:m.106763 g.106763  ORF g.106763 m.106763 type:complete len:583 (-) comp10599_c5_seq1:630-2378(-)